MLKVSLFIWTMAAHFFKSEICIPERSSSFLLNTRVPSEVNLANVIRPEGTNRHKTLTKKLKCSLSK